MATATARPRPTPAELDDELQTRLDLELGHPRRRTTARVQRRDDENAVEEIAHALRNPHWNTELLEEICDIIRDTGRQVTGPPLAVMAS
jgi:hypothetical protein